MAQVKEPYGLVYNTDGSLCVTYRDDDIPFRGVRSFAVEETTKNLIQNPQFATGDFTSWSVVDPENFELDEGHKARYSVKSLPNDTTSFRALRQTFNTVVGQQYTISFWIRHSTEVNRWARFYLYLKSALAPGFGNIHTISSSFFDGQWHKLTYTFTAQYDSYYISLESAPNQANGLSWISDIQVEQKPYPTSFVDGSRAGGIVNFSGFNIAPWVVSYWYKNTYPGSVGENGFGVRFQQDSGYLYFRNGLDNATIFLSQDIISNQFTLGAENLSDGQWRNFVIVFDSAFKLYINGILRATVVSLDFTRKLTGVQFDGKTNSLLSNIFIGKYRKPNGDIIWTDDYIREVYEAKIPFPVQSQLSIY